MANMVTSMWDAHGLPRETRVNGQSWNPNGISIFFHQLSFQDYIYWDAIYWRTGYLDRQVGEYRDRFVAELDQRFHVETLEDRNERASWHSTQIKSHCGTSAHGFSVCATT